MYEQQYINNLKYILEHGAREYNERTGIETLRVPSTQIIIDLSKEFPILQSKKVFWKSAIDEILWIMQKQSNKTSELNSKIWDAWTGPDGTIGKSYGYQVAKSVVGYDNQVEYVLESLARDPSSRQAVINLWNVEELGQMNLKPCTYSSVWNIIDGKLNCMLVQRSADYPVGVPFDTTQYAVLTHLFARHLGVAPGILTHVMADSHIYANQIEGVKQQLDNYENICENKTKIFIEGSPNFWDVKLSDISIVDYHPCGIIKYEVAK